jgi:hypothetical protein
MSDLPLQTAKKSPGDQGTQKTGQEKSTNVQTDANERKMARDVPWDRRAETKGATKQGRGLWPQNCKREE